MNNKLALVFIGVLISLKFVIVPWFDWIEATTEDIQQKERSFAKLSRLSKQQEQAQIDIGKLEAVLKPLEQKKLPASRAKITKITLDYMNNLGDEFNVTVRNQRLGDVQEGRLDYIPLNLMLEGNPIGISKFIREIETGKYVALVAQASVIKDSRVKENLSLNLTLYLTIESKK